MAHDGTQHVIIVDDETGEELLDDWCDILKFRSEKEAEQFIDEHELDGVHTQWYQSI